MEKDILLLHRMLQEGACCSQCLVRMGLAVRQEQNRQLEEAAAGLCGGVGAGMLCGALTGGAMCLSLFDPELAQAEMIPDLAEWFRETCGEAYGGTDCHTILSGDPSNKPLRCPGIVENVWRKIREILEDEGFEPELPEE